ncbi:hypothetical protein LOD99_13834 [Oopsacas minuta]|uniref:BZIP domain-containing protein n=1 Tax=Oopsacas minuta TaxID=111878 RepID=A0AAV7KID6_9METZ|nr:hypothetical protein LOD99_13834 [Oopsacas minuta]
MNYNPILNTSSFQNNIIPYRFENYRTIIYNPNCNELITISNTNKSFEFSNTSPNFSHSPSAKVLSSQNQAVERSKIKRRKNNDAVRKSRYRAKQRARTAVMKARILTVANQSLGQTIQALEVELTGLKKTIDNILQDSHLKHSFNCPFYYNECSA